MKERQKISVTEAKEKLRVTFGIRPDGPSSEKDGVFSISPSQASRKDVVGTVFKFFSEHELTDGDCEILHGADSCETVFRLTGRNPKSSK